MKTLASLCAIAALCCAVSAQQPASQPAQQKTAVYAAHLLDGKTGKTLDRVTIAIAGDKIESVAAGTTPPHTGANVINLGEATILPGLIDAHTHLTSDPVFGYQQLGISIPKEALVGAKNARLTL